MRVLLIFCSVVILLSVVSLLTFSLEHELSSHLVLVALCSAVLFSARVLLRHLSGFKFLESLTTRGNNDLQNTSRRTVYHLKEDHNTIQMSFSSVLTNSSIRIIIEKNETETGIKKEEKKQLHEPISIKKDCRKGKTTSGDGRLLGNTIATLEYI